MSKNKKFTKREQVRIKHFENISKKMESYGYIQKYIIFDLVKANIFSVFIMAPFVIISWLIFTKNVHSGFFALRGFDGFKFLLMVVILATIHELIHGFFAGMFAREHFQSVEIGVSWYILTPYCYCKEPLKKWQYVVYGLSPTIIIGICLMILSVTMESSFVFALLVIMLVGGGGDALVALNLLRYRTDGKKVYIYDHPYELGLVIFEKSV